MAIKTDFNWLNCWNWGGFHRMCSFFHFGRAVTKAAFQSWNMHPMKWIEPNWNSLDIITWSIGTGYGRKTLRYQLISPQVAHCANCSIAKKICPNITIYGTSFPFPNRILLLKLLNIENSIWLQFSLQFHAAHFCSPFFSLQLLIVVTLNVQFNLKEHFQTQKLNITEVCSRWMGVCVTWSKVSNWIKWIWPHSGTMANVWCWWRYFATDSSHTLTQKMVVIKFQFTWIAQSIAQLFPW